MIRNIPRRALTTSWLTLALLGGVLAGPTTSLAATPNWHMDDPVPLPPQVIPGQDAGFLVTITNDGPSNISQLYLTSSPAPGPDTTYVSADHPGCDPAGVPLYCDFGALRKNESVTVIVAFPTLADAQSYTHTFEANTTGISSDPKDNSHGDALTKSATVELNSNAQDFSGYFMPPDEYVQNLQTISETNPQSTLVEVPPGAIGVSVEDGPGVSASCPASLNCFTETSEIHVYNGTFYDGGFLVYIQLDSSQLPPGVNKNNLHFWHQFDTPRLVKGELVDGEAITDACKFVGNSDTPKNIPCVDVVNLGGGDLGAYIYLNVNGFLRGY